MAGLTIQQILHEGYAAFEQSHPVPGYVRKAVWALLACRTASLGGRVPACPAGHIERVRYTSCGHGVGPQCRWLQSERWLVRQEARLWASHHDHAIFTMADALRSLWLTTVKPMTKLLLATVRTTLYELLGDAESLGARPGIIPTLHTWSQTLVLVSGAKFPLVSRCATLRAQR